MSSDRVVVLTAMPVELRPVVRALSLQRAPASGAAAYRGRVATTEVVAAATGIGTALATATTERMLADGADHVLMVGIAGGIDPALAIGDVVTPTDALSGVTGGRYPAHGVGTDRLRGTVHTSDELVIDPEVIAGLLAQGVVALDMETAAVAAVCAARRCPWSAYRAISDRPDDGILDDDLLGLARPDGSADAGAAVRLLLRRPATLPRMLRLARGTQRAVAAAAAAAARSVHVLAH